MKYKEKQIEEMSKDVANIHRCFLKNENFKILNDYIAIKLIEQGYRKLTEDSMVLSKEEYEKLKSLYDTQKGAIITSSIGDLPLTIEGLRKAVDEITRLNKVETELQELNAKYYNEAKDLRRELNKTISTMYNEEEFEYEINKKVEEELERVEEQASKETAEKILQGFEYCNDTSFYLKWLELCKQFGVEIKEQK